MTFQRILCSCGKGGGGRNAEIVWEIDFGGSCFGVVLSLSSFFAHGKKVRVSQMGVGQKKEKRKLIARFFMGAFFPFLLPLFNL